MLYASMSNKPDSNKCTYVNYVKCKRPFVNFSLLVFLVPLVYLIYTCFTVLSEYLICCFAGPDLGDGRPGTHLVWWLTGWAY